MENTPPLELYFLTCKQELNDLIAEHNTLICRISGVSDVVLKEQLSEEYIMLDDKISVAQARFNEAEKLLTDSLISDWYGDHLEFYRGQFVKSSLVDCIEKINNTNISNAIKKLCIRVPTSIAATREMHFLANTLNITIKILNIDGTFLSCIGTYDSTLIIYVNADGEFMLPVALI